MTHTSTCISFRLRSISAVFLGFAFSQLVGCSSDEGTPSATGGTGGNPDSTGGETSSANGTGGSSTAATGTGGTTATGGEGTGGATDPATPDVSACDDAALTWKTAQKTNYTSYPEPGSVECVEYNGCMWEGLFAGCDGKQTESWVEAHNIAAIFPDYGSLAGHELCLRSDDTRMIVHILDTCADSDCSGCCTENQGDKDALIDLESYTNARWGLPDGTIEWADLGAAPSPCE